MSTSSGRTLRWDFLGRMPYAQAFDAQVAARKGILDGEGDEHLLLLEHQPVFTLGRNADATDVLASASWLEAQGIEVVETDRGGQVTYHGPGQLVGYPIIDLKPDRRDIRLYVRDLQEVLLRTLAYFGLDAERRDGKDFIGVWVGDHKIASIGVHLKRWVTTHGFALNVSTDLGFFRGIVACGLPEVQMASIASLTGERIDLIEVSGQVAKHFAEIFDRRLMPLDPAAVGLLAQVEQR